ncbi:SAM-dependent chlorinase/fluorinase [Weeksellaceae bacterium A-14]|uniref:SAM hydrolase/SAM-dependent halogenase family protein n=1 Tax=Daejeonia sp. YH14 TaxID=3439042 RepID=UPI0031E4C924
MAIITLTSDYGNVDHRVAAIKGSIMSLSSDIRIVDITHGIDAYNLKQTAYIVRNAYRYFPAGSVHIVSVDSFYRKEVKNVLYRADGHYFIAADNGVLGLVLYDIKPEAVYEITLNNRFDDKVNFTSTDIFVPAAVHLCNGGLPEVIGRPLKKPLEVKVPRAVHNPSENMIIGEVMYIDNFGNIVSNISRKFFEDIFIKTDAVKYTIKFRNLILSTIHSQYTDFIPDWSREREYHGKSVAIFNDVGLLELCVYKGNKHNGARTLFGLKVGEKIYIEFQ